MRYILLVLFVLVTTFASAQVQYLGSPTTTVRNRGNFVSDSLFYLPKRTKAPSDTGAIRYQISDSALYVWTGSAWRTAGTAGSAITGSGVAGYMPEFTTATNIDTTRLYHSNGRFAIGTTSPISFFDIIGTKAPGGGEQEGIRIIGSIAARQGISFGYDSTSADQYAIIQSHTGSERTTINYQAEKHKFTYGQVENAALYIDSIGRVGINNSASSYNLDVTGNLRTTTSAIIASSSGNLSVGTTEIGAKVDIRDANSDLLRVARTSAGNMLVQYINATTTDDIIHRFRLNNGSGNFYDLRYYGTGGYFGLQYNGANGLHLNTSSEVLIGTNLDAGAYALQVAGSIYNTNDAYFGVSSGRLGVGTSTGAGKISSIQTGVVSPTNAAYWLSHDGSAGSTDGLAIGTNGSASYKWIQSYNGALSINSAGNDVLIGTNLDAGAYDLQVAGAIYNTTTITTGAPTSGSAKPWRLGEAATVSPTSPNRTIRVEIDGTVYYIHAKTTND